MPVAEDGGPAFARPASALSNPPDWWGPQSGMTLRDYFAGQALAAIIEADGIQYAGNSTSWVTHAAMAYGHADAMLAARSADSSTGRKG